MTDITRDGSAALRVLYGNFDRFDGARQASQQDPASLGYGSRAEASAGFYADGIVSPNDLRAVVDGGLEAGYTQQEIDAAGYLLENGDFTDAVDVAADGDGGVDDRIAEHDIIAFLNANRDDPDLDYRTLAIADAANILEVGRRDGEDDYDARMAAFAARVGELEPEQARALLAEIRRQDEGARESWLQPARLEQAGIDPGDRAAVLDLIPRLASQLPAPADGSVRFMTYNLGQGASRGEGRGTDFDELDRAAQVIADSDADIIAVQEIISDDVATLEDELQAIEDERAAAEGREPRDVTITFSEASEKRGRYESGRYTADEYGFGNAVITYGPQETIYGQDQPALPESGGEGRRVLGVTTVVDGRTVTVFNTHLSDEEGGRAEQIEAAFDIVSEHGGDGPVIFAGDFNQTIDGDRDDYSGEQLEARDAFVEGLEDSGLVDTGAGAGPTGNWGYGSRIDYVLAGGAEADAVHRVDPGPADHAALVVDLQVQD